MTEMATAGMLTRSPSSSRAIPACFSLQLVKSHFRWGRLCRHALTCTHTASNHAHADFDVLGGCRLPDLCLSRS